MTLESMQRHESVTLRHSKDDFRRAGIIRLVRSHVRGPRVLDMRCLGGELAVELAGEGFEVAALDVFAEAVDMTNTLARRQGIAGPIAHHWDLTGLVERTGEHRFDTVICLDVLNHVRDDQETMSDVARVLAEDGRLLLVAPAFPGLLGKRDRTLGHLRRYTRRGVIDLLERHGLKPQFMRYWNFAALPLYVVIERMMSRKISDKLRYGWEGTRFGGLPNRLLRWWYRSAEYHLRFPCGLSHFVIAHKAGVRSSPGHMPGKVSKVPGT